MLGLTAIKLNNMNITGLTVMGVLERVGFLPSKCL